MFARDVTAPEPESSRLGLVLGVSIPASLFVLWLFGAFYKQ